MTTTVKMKLKLKLKVTFSLVVHRICFPKCQDPHINPLLENHSWPLAFGVAEQLGATCGKELAKHGLVLLPQTAVQHAHLFEVQWLKHSPLSSAREEVAEVVEFIHKT